MVETGEVLEQSAVVQSPQGMNTPPNSSQSDGWVAVTQMPFEQHTPSILLQRLHSAHVVTVSCHVPPSVPQSYAVVTVQVVPVQHTASALQMLVAAHVSIVECHVPPCPSQLYCVRTVQSILNAARRLLWCAAVIIDKVVAST